MYTTISIPFHKLCIKGDRMYSNIKKQPVDIDVPNNFIDDTFFFN
jgi:hypothetical protein